MPPILISEISERKLAIKIRSICHMSTSVIFDRSLFSKNEFKERNVVFSVRQRVFANTIPQERWIHEIIENAKCKETQNSNYIQSISGSSKKREVSTTTFTC